MHQPHEIAQGIVLTPVVALYDTRIPHTAKGHLYKAKPRRDTALLRKF
jgi:hypothetical protein